MERVVVSGFGAWPHHGAVVQQLQVDVAGTDNPPLGVSATVLSYTGSLRSFLGWLPCNTASICHVQATSEIVAKLNRVVFFQIQSKLDVLCSVAPWLADR